MDATRAQQTSVALAVAALVAADVVGPDNADDLLGASDPWRATLSFVMCGLALVASAPSLARLNGRVWVGAAVVGALGGLSALDADHPRSAALLGLAAALFWVALASPNDERRPTAWNSLVATSAALCLAGLIVGLIGAETSLEPDTTRLGIRRWSGIATNPNAAGVLASITLMGAFWPRRRPNIRWTLSAIGITAVLASQTQAALLALLCSGLVALWLRFRQARGVMALLLLTSLAAAALAGPVDLANRLSREQNLDKTLTFNGRTELWGEALSDTVDGPLFGRGLANDGLARTDRAGEPRSVRARSAHNSWLSMGVSWGLPGLVLAITLAAAALWAVARRGRCGLAPFVGLAVLASFSPSSGLLDPLFLAMAAVWRARAQSSADAPRG